MAKFLLRFLASQTVEMHIRSFGPLLRDGVVDNSKGRGVVCLHWCRWLRIYHRDDHMASGDGFAEIDIEGAKLGLGSG